MRGTISNSEPSTINWSRSFSVKPDVREDIVKRELCFSVMIAIAELQCEAALWVSVDGQHVMASIGEAHRRG